MAGRAEEHDVARLGEEAARGERGELTGPTGWASKSKSSRVLTAPNPPALIRGWAPGALLAATSRSRTAAR